MIKTPLQKCPHCKGTGQLELSNALAATLAKFPAGKKLAVSDLHDPQSDVSQNAINNRLETLRARGHLDRERQGRWFVYFKPKKKKEAASPMDAQPKCYADPTLRTRNGNPKRNPLKPVKRATKR